MRDAAKISGSYRTTRGRRPPTTLSPDRRRVVLDVGAPRPLGPRSFQLTIVARRKRPPSDST
jgi:hypothetical protein